MAEDALEHLEQFAAHGGLLMAPEDMEALKSVCRELKAAREAVHYCNSLPRNGRSDATYIAKKMTATRTNPLTPAS